MDKSISLYLDIYHRGKRKYEFLNMCKLSPSKSPIDKVENKQKLALAEQIKTKRSLQLQSGEYDITPQFQQDIDFLQFFEAYLLKYTKKDKRVMNACYGKFKQFMSEVGLKSLTTKQVNESLVEDFKEFLEDTMHGETPANYFKKFKKVLKFGVKEKILLVSPAQDLTAKRNEGIKKEILTMEEIQQLAQATCTNDQVKRAFLFCCVTGLRWCDVNVLKWRNINGKVLKINQQKTAKDVTVNMNQNAIELIGEAGKPDQKVFSLPSHTSCIKGLATWCKRAGIQKKITWHCARHSFATNIIYYGSDVNSASSLLGHSSLTYTQRYLRVVNELKEKAVESLPSLKL